MDLNLVEELLKPFEVVGVPARRFDIRAFVHGGGHGGQMGALRLGVSRALCRLDSNISDGDFADGGSSGSGSGRGSGRSSGSSSSSGSGSGSGSGSDGDIGTADSSSTADTDSAHGRVV